MINKLIELSPKFVDLTNPEHLELIKEIVISLLKEYDDLHKMDVLEKELISKNDKSLIFILLAIKIARSKMIIEKIKEPVTISVVFAVYKEHNRIRKNSEHSHGEDFLRRKVSQLKWLLDDSPYFKWELIVVDDGCPEDSGKIAQNIIDSENLNSRVRVLFLEEAIQNKLAVTKSLSSTSNSQKGGAIIYGMWHAVSGNKNVNHIVIYTDADLSTHLGQVGLLIDPLLKGDKSVAIASRREKTSVVIKKGSRNNRGKLFIYLWKRLIPNLGSIIDTQCGFKAFKKEIINEIIENLIEMKFAFDLELLLKAQLINDNSIAKVPIAWIDSEEASTTTDIQPYLPMLKSIAAMYRKYLPPNQISDEFASFIESLTEDEFNKILDNIPDDIVDREPLEFAEFKEVSAADLKICIGAT